MTDIKKKTTITAAAATARNIRTLIHSKLKLKSKLLPLDKHTLILNTEQNSRRYGECTIATVELIFPKTGTWFVRSLSLSLWLAIISF